MKVKKVQIEFVMPDGLRTETHTSTVKIGCYQFAYKKQTALNVICKKYKVNRKRRFFMQVFCVGGLKYNYYNKGSEE